LCQQVLVALSEVVAAPLGHGKQRWRLADVPCASRLNELEFHLPVAGVVEAATLPRGTQLELELSGSTRPRAPGPDGKLALTRLSRDKLAQAFAAHPSPELAPGYAARVAELGFVPLEGFLKGYIDLIFERGGRYYLADYKTTHLGDERGAYRRERVVEAMVHGHYYLQYHLYAVALHRWLARRLAGYRYARHFGGVFYLFLKGMAPDDDTGIFFERPPEGRIEALSAAFGPSSQARGASRSVG
jgi:ATP-dependent exoDNAse (exonuclease V) beta subunit